MQMATRHEITKENPREIILFCVMQLLSVMQANLQNMFAFIA